MIEGPKRSMKFYATQAELLSSVSSGQQELCSLTPTYFMNFVGSGSCGGWRKFLPSSRYVPSVSGGGVREKLRRKAARNLKLFQASRVRFNLAGALSLSQHSSYSRFYISFASPRHAAKTRLYLSLALHGPGPIASSDPNWHMNFFGARMSEASGICKVFQSTWLPASDWTSQASDCKTLIDQPLPWLVRSILGRSAWH